MTSPPAGPMRVLHWVPAIRFDQGGVVRSILDWCAVLADRGATMSLAVYDGRDLPPAWLVDGHNPRAYVVPVPRLPLKRLGRPAMQLLGDLLGRADVLHLHAPWLDGNRQLAALARRRGVPYVVTLHGMLDDWPMTRRAWKKRAYLAVAGRRLLDAAAVVHCTADAELAQARRWFANPSTLVVPYLVDLRPYADPPASDRPGGDATLLFLSRLSEQKGLDLLIRAAGRMRDRGVRFSLVVAGTGEGAYVDQIRRLVASLGLADRVTFAGQVNGPAKVALLRSADVFVLPTRHENFGLVLAEAMACGTAVLTTRGTDVWPDVKRAGGVVVAEATPEALAAAATALLADPADRHRRAAAGRRWVFDALAVDSVARRYEAVYRSVLHGSVPHG